MDKLLIRGRLQTIKNNYALAQAGIALLALPDARARLDEVFSLLKVHPETQAIRYIDYVFEDNDLLKSATVQFRNAVLRNCMKELFDQVKLYGRQTNQMQVIEAAPWYQPSCGLCQQQTQEKPGVRITSLSWRPLAAEAAVGTGSFRQNLQSLIFNLA